MDCQICGRREWEHDYCPPCVEEYFDALKLINPAMQQYRMCDFKESNLEFTYGILLEIWQKKNAASAETSEGSNQVVSATP